VPVRALLFDFDGTLVDTGPDELVGIAGPNPVTHALDLGVADLVFHLLAGLPPAELPARR